MYSCIEISKFEQHMDEKKSTFKQDMVTYINEHIDDTELRILDLCKHFCLGRTYLFLKIKQTFDTTPRQLIQGIRLTTAATMLIAYPETSISHIAYSVGFQSPKHFSKCFKHKYQKTASQYRKQNVKSK